MKCTYYTIYLKYAHTAVECLLKRYKWMIDIVKYILYYRYSY